MSAPCVRVPALGRAVATCSVRAAHQLAGLVDDLCRFPSEFRSFFPRLGDNGFSVAGLLLRALLFLGMGVLGGGLFRSITKRIGSKPASNTNVTLQPSFWLARSQSGWPFHFCASGRMAAFDERAS